MPLSRAAERADELTLAVALDAGKPEELTSPGSHLATGYIPDAAAFSESRARRVSDGFRRFGFDGQLSDLVCEGRRSDVIDYLSAHGWDVAAQSLEEICAANRFELPGGDMFVAFADVRTVNATLREVDP